MNVLFKNQTYCVDFVYDVLEAGTHKPVQPNGKQSPLSLAQDNIVKTTCRIGIHVKKGEIELVAGATVTKIPKDKFNKSLGRNMAFNKAVNLLKNRELRTVLWSNYFESHRDSKIDSKRKQELIATG